MEFRDKFAEASSKVFMIRLIIIISSVVVLGVILFFCLAMGLKSDPYLKIKPNTSGQKVVLTQDFLKEEYKEFVEKEEKPEATAFYIVFVLGIVAVATPVVIFIVKKVRGTFRAWNLAYLIPIFVSSFGLLLFAYMLSGSVQSVKRVGQPCDVEVVKVIDKEWESSSDSETNTVSYNYYVTFEGSKWHTWVSEAEFNLFEEGAEYYKAKCGGKGFRYYPVDQYELE